ncbi:MAG: MFS transporter, partial [Pedobacter sp.]
MNPTIRVKLSFMMFLEFFIWGAWFVTMGTYLGKNLLSNDVQIGSAYSTQSLGAIIAPFIIGLIADKFFSAQKVLGFLHLTGGILLWFASTSLDFDSFFPFILGYMIAYMPTLALVNSISFKQMNNPGKEFPSIRVFGTIGWIIAGLLISFVFHWDSPEGIQTGLLKNTFLMAGIVSLVLGLFSFTLPKTPPKVSSTEKIKIGDLIGLDALKLLKDKNFAIFFIS